MNSSKRFKIVIALVSLLVILSVLSISIWSIFRQDFKKTYVIKFYEENNLVTEVEKPVYERLSKLELIEINKKINNLQNEDYLLWSKYNDSLEEIDFSKIYTNTSVYLHRKHNQIKINIEDTDEYWYYIDQKDIIKYNDTVKISIEQIVSKDKYKMYVEANGELLERSNDGFYYIENVKQDVDVKVHFKKIVKVVSKIDEGITYNGEIQNLPYEIVDGDGNSIETDMLEITYFDSDNQQVDGMLNAGEYVVMIHYLGDEYYFEDITIPVVVNKKLPNLEILKTTFGYKGITQYFDKTCLITDSDGALTLTNNEFKAVGSYDVLIKIEETTNYLGLEETIQIIVRSGVPEIIKLPSVRLGYEGETLNDISIIGGETNVEGIFKWKENTTLKVGKHSYKMLFIPNEITEYEELEFNYTLEVISYKETLRRIKTDRNEIYDLLASALNDEVTTIDSLPLYGTMYKSSITWISSSTILRINNNGETMIIGNAGKYQVTLIGYMMLGNTAEYVRFSFEVVIPEENNIIQAPTDNEVEIPKLNLQKYEQKELVDDKKVNSQPFIYQEKVDYQSNVLLNVMDIEFSKLEQLVVNITTEKQRVEYKARCTNREVISEIILWKIVSDSAGEGAHNNKLETKQIRYINFMKGENRI